MLAGRSVLLIIGGGIAAYKSLELIRLIQRSGLALKQGVALVNSPGTIDADYRGELGVIVINHGTEPVTIDHGMRIAQILLAPVTRIAWRETDALGETARGAGGFGSTGAK